PDPAPPATTESGAVLVALRRLRRYESDAGRRAILLDLAPGPLDVHGLFGRFRDELWQLPFTWIVAAPTTMRPALFTPPAAAFFDDAIELGELSHPQQQEVVARRAEPGGSETWHLPSDGEGNLRRLLQILRESKRSGEPLEFHFDAHSKREQEVSA